MSSFTTTSTFYQPSALSTAVAQGIQDVKTFFTDLSRTRLGTTIPSVRPQGYILEKTPTERPLSSPRTQPGTSGQVLREAFFFTCNYLTSEWGEGVLADFIKDFWRSQVTTKFTLKVAQAFVRYLHEQPTTVAPLALELACYECASLQTYTDHQPRQVELRYDLSPVLMALRFGLTPSLTKPGKHGFTLTFDTLLEKERLARLVLA